MYVVDASVWVSRFLPADADHEPSYHWLEGMVDRGVLIAVPALMLIEVAGAVSRRTGRPELAVRAVRLLEEIPSLRIVPVDAQMARLGASLAGEIGLRGADALYVSLARRLAFTLVTWDREQLERADPNTEVMVPA